MASQDSFIRLVNVYLRLLNARSPVTIDSILNEVDGFSGNNEANRQAFERTKRELRNFGVEIETVKDENGHDGYIISDRNSAKITLDLTLEEGIALSLAMATVRFGSFSGSDSVKKLGLFGQGREVFFTALPSDSNIVEIAEASWNDVTIVGQYNGRMREIEPYQLIFKFGAWFVAGREVGHEIFKTFRTDLFDGGVSRSDHGFKRVDDFDPETLLPESPSQIKFDDAFELRLEVPHSLLEVVIERLPQLEVLGSDDEFVHAKAIITSRYFLRTFCMEFGEFVSIEDGNEKHYFSQSIKRSLDFQQMASTFTQEVEKIRQMSLPGTSLDEDSSKKRTSGAEQFHRAATLLPWLYRNERTDIHEIAELLAITPKQVIPFIHTLACCGLPPYTPDVMIDIYLEKDEVIAYINEKFVSNLRFSIAEILVAIISAQITISSVGGAVVDPLRSALGKIVKASKLDLSDVELVSIEFDGANKVEPLRAAISSRRGISFHYLSVSSKSYALRRVAPVILKARGEAWYLDAYCFDTNSMRTFRLDRMGQIEEFEVEVWPSKELVENLSGYDFDFTDSSGVVDATILVQRDNLWQLRAASYREIALFDDWKVVEIDVASPNWLFNLIGASDGNIAVVLPPYLQVHAINTLMEVAKKNEVME
ncbi:MAG: WYL domain-containing protein [Actinomycetota bacterium]|nr:WYL domain-containing protein [Actinomycetota bacterium]